MKYKSLQVTQSHYSIWYVVRTFSTCNISVFVCTVEHKRVRARPNESCEWARWADATRCHRNYYGFYWQNIKWIQWQTAEKKLSNFVVTSKCISCSRIIPTDGDARWQQNVIRIGCEWKIKRLYGDLVEWHKQQCQSRFSNWIQMHFIWIAKLLKYTNRRRQRPSARGERSSWNTNEKCEIA